jgi:hypothetical protein
MKRILNLLPVIILTALVFIVFRAWFMQGLISAGDLWPFYKSMYAIRPLSLYAWDWTQGAGLGGYSGALLWLYLNFGIPVTTLGRVLGLSWSLIERIYFIYPFLLVNAVSSYVLFKKLFKNNKFSIIASAVFLLNTYSLMIVGGGQFGVGLSYALMPIVLLSFIKNVNFLKINLSNFGWSVLAGVVLSIQIILDLRIAYISLIAILIYWLIKVILDRNLKRLLFSFLITFIVPAVTSLFLNLFWILPTIVNRQNPLAQLGSAYVSLGAVKFFSFAQMEDALGLMHPNWPENIFGKVGFMKPEFLLLPILAFVSLLFIRKTKDQQSKIYILFFVLLALIGAFLAKGANDPFGNLYLWSFGHIPGFMMFRDPTKWYALVAVSYSILIPFSIWKMYERLQSLPRLKIYDLRFMTKDRIINIQNLFLLLLTSYFLLLINPAWLGQLGGAFNATTIPKEYTKLEKFMSSRDNFSRTLWVPTVQRFAFFNNQHPVVPAQDLFKLYNNPDIFKTLNTTKTEELLQELGIKYVVVPFDSQGEIFLNDRRYDNKAYLKLISELKSINWLKQVDGFGRIAVFEVPDVKEHFYFNNQKTISNNQRLKYQYISPVEYKLDVTNAKKGNVIVFAENYDKNWVATSVSGSKFKVVSSKFDNRLNSFLLSAEGSYSLNVYYTLQKYVDYGVMISAASLVLVVGFLIFEFLRRKVGK